MTDDAITTPDELKRQRILDGAAKVFLSYGFQRTTMDDIARAAEMSRPALYLLFRNKTDIYRGIAETYLQTAADQGRAALAGEGALADRLTASVEGLIAMMEQFASSPHGADILDMKNSLAADIIETWRSAMAARVAEAVAQEARANGVDLAGRGYSADGLAELFWDAIDGVKTRIHEPARQREAVRLLAELVAQAVRR